MPPKGQNLEKKLQLAMEKESKVSLSFEH